MIGKSVVYNLFGTTNDLATALRVVEHDFDLEYVECGLFDDRQQPIRHTLSMLDELSIAHAGDSNLEKTFLLKPRERDLIIREVPQKRGATKYAVDQSENPGTVVIRPGGRYGDWVLIAGMVGTIHHDRDARRLIAAFSAEPPSA